MASVAGLTEMEMVNTFLHFLRRPSLRIVYHISRSFARPSSCDERVQPEVDASARTVAATSLSTYIQV